MCGKLFLALRDVHHVKQLVDDAMLVPTRGLDEIGINRPRAGWKKNTSVCY